MALDFAAGCLGGCAGVLVGYPFDTVKLHLQTQDFRNPLYKGTLDCFRKIIAKETVRGLYRGMSSPMAGVAVVNAIVFGIYGNVQRRTADPDSLHSHFLAGTAAGLTQSFVCSPMELIKTRLQLQGNLPKGAFKFKGPLDCLRHIARTEGFRGVFRGLGITAARDMPGFSSYFVSYELMVRSVDDPSPFSILMAGGLAGTISWLLTFPVDVVKSRLQADGMSGKPQYLGIVDCLRKSYATEGLSFLSRGLASTLLRAFPMNALCFLVVSIVMKSFGESSLNLELSPAEPLLMVQQPAGAVKVTMNKRHHELHDIHILNIKQNTYRFLSFLGAFSEAVCCAEMDELAHDLHSNEDGGYYYSKLNEYLQSTNPEYCKRFPFID
ncbi:mitochondrial basic amino acids transporter [Wyeomyia smithii]|uniref:mitochondrial basic amino acids transporter n=1 Tax=Wyeomyia smithii TaxID=174621 RepID=UPI002467F89F|nr:mitochondrial basic amino acids transporter [Wyeomyia smithii]XP_055542259.1 mitochondrial basic amino acids transporter [Wyeomyia smithii]